MQQTKVHRHGKEGWEHHSLTVFQASQLSYRGRGELQSTSRTEWFPMVPGYSVKLFFKGILRILQLRRESPTLWVRHCASTESKQ